MKKIIALILMILLVFCMALSAHAGLVKRKSKVIPTKTILGIERMQEPEIAAIFAGKRVGVFTNQSGIDSKLNSSIDLLRDKLTVNAIFVPEHGLLGAVAAGEKFSDSKYEGITVYSLYGNSRRPSKEMLESIDIIAVDIQDVGVRHYTYTSSLAYIMEECAKFNKQVVVFDRPNPLGGAIQGPVLKEKFKSFIGLYTIPLRHGLTIGEFAAYINTEEKINCNLKVIPMKNWRRSMLWQDTKLPWVQTSPLIPTAETTFLYGTTGVCGDTNLSVGVGTAKPFYFIGAPFADADKVVKSLQNLGIEGVAFRKAAFTPKYGKYKDELVKGAEIYILNPREVNFPELGYLLANTMQKLYSKEMAELPARSGSKGLVVEIALGEDSLVKQEEPVKVFARWRQECQLFKEKSSPYLLYK